MEKSCGQHDFFSLGGQYYSLGQSNVYHHTLDLSKEVKHGGNSATTNKISAE